MHCSNIGESRLDAAAAFSRRAVANQASNMGEAAVLRPEVVLRVTSWPILLPCQKQAQRISSRAFPFMLPPASFMLRTRITSRALRLSFAILSIGLVSSCRKTDTPTSPADSVATVAVLPGTPALTFVGETVQLAASATRTSGAAVTGGTYTWSTADAAVATVSTAGLVTAVGAGTAVVSATLEGVAGTATVTVGLLANTVIVTPSADTLVSVGETLQLAVEVRDAGGTVLGTPGGAWTSSLPGVATVSTTGEVTAVANGTTVVKYTLNSATDSAVITVALPAPGSAAWQMESSAVQPQYGTWGSSTTDYWSVGGGGSILHFNGSTWSDLSGVTTETLEGVWGAAADDVWAVGWNGTMLHYDGSQWAEVDISGVTTDHLRAIWGTSASDVWAVGGTSSAEILHYDGSTWSAQGTATSSPYYDVSGSAANDVYAVGSSGTIAHFDGSGWSSMTSSTSATLLSVWASAPDDVWATATNDMRSGWFIHYDGVSWSLFGLGTRHVRDIWGSAARRDRARV